jgi:general secretion pathway protein G
MTHDGTTARRCLWGESSTQGRAFTLVELLIILLILGVLAALVLPGYSTATTTARESNLIDNLRHVRTQLLVYSAQHGGRAPGFPDGDDKLSPSAEVFVEQMTTYSDPIGRTSPTPTDQHHLGPYLRKIPVNPFNLNTDVRIVPGSASFPSSPVGSEGWFYQPATLTFVANTEGEDKSGRAYFDY